jgi:hypothetical protein
VRQKLGVPRRDIRSVDYQTGVEDKAVRVHHLAAS